MTLRRLLFSTMLDLVLAVLIGAAAGTLHLYGVSNGVGQATALFEGLEALGVSPARLGLQDQVDRASSTWAYQYQLECDAVPVDDRALENWFLAQPEYLVRDSGRHDLHHQVGRDTQLVSVNYFASADAKPPAPPLKEFGYSMAAPAGPGTLNFTGLFVHPPPNPRMSPAIELAMLYVSWLQLGFALVGLVRIWRNRYLGADRPPLWGPPLRAVLGGLAVGLALGGLYWAYDQALLHFVGPPQATSSPWRCAPSITWNSPVPFESSVARLAVVVLVVLGFPLGQEAFFRAGLFGMWWGAGRIWAGAVLTALCGAILALDWFYFPFTLLTGLMLAGVYRWSRSLLAPLLAHLLLNAVAVGMIYGFVPGLSAPTTAIVGSWQEIDAPKAKGIELLHGGGVKGGRRQDKLSGVQPFGVSYVPLRYEFVDRDHIDIRWSKMESKDTFMVVTEMIRYEISVGPTELTLTQVKDGKVVKYRRLH